MDWSTLRRLRAGFLEGVAGRSDYWQSDSDLAQYDATFAQRIGWKWDFVLEDLRRLGWHPPGGNLLDWGCGSGVASRAFLDHFSSGGSRRLWLADRSMMAVAFAAERARARFPELEIGRGIPESIDLLIISHVLTELSIPDVEGVIQLIDRATSLLWVEPGTFETSLNLIAIRERLRDRFHLVAPCPHRERCGILAAGNEGHWCHQFATPPEFVFRDAFWSSFSRAMEIDLRSLPVSYLVLDRRGNPELPADAVRIVGRPMMFKPHAVLLGCTAGQLIEARVERRSDPEGYRRLKKGDCPALQIWDREGTRITSWKSVPAATGR